MSTIDDLSCVTHITEVSGLAVFGLGASGL